MRTGTSEARLSPPRPEQHGSRRRKARVTAVLAAFTAVALSVPTTPDSRAGTLLDASMFDLDSLDPAVARAAAPALAEWIRRSRGAAITAGTAPIPAAVREALAGHVPGHILDSVRWCLACGDALSLQHSALRLGRVPAVTLDDVIVFAPAAADVDDPALWAHELRHVMQYADWSIDGFAQRYLEDHGAIELEAANFRWQWMKRTDDPRTVAPATRAARERARGTRSTE